MEPDYLGYWESGGRAARTKQVLHAYFMRRLSCRMLFDKLEDCYLVSNLCLLVLDLLGFE